MLHNAQFYQLYEKKLQCTLCPHRCFIADYEYGLCSVRKRENNILKTLNYAEITAIAIDPIEKKPLYHFKPGQNILSVGSFGCNFSCQFCQNYSIAHFKSPSKSISSAQLIDLSLKENNIGIAFTYNEPVIWFEYVMDTAQRLKESYPDKKIVLVTNGYIEEKPLQQILPYVDALNIDLKSYNTEFYKQICGGRIEPVLRTIELASQSCHVEITTLLVNGMNDSLHEVDRIATFLAKINKKIPLHLSRYFPAYKLKSPATELSVLFKAREAARKHLEYVYLGNVSGSDNSTYCPRCGKLLIHRAGYKVKLNMNSDSCGACGYKTKIIF